MLEGMARRPTSLVHELKKESIFELKAHCDSSPSPSSLPSSYYKSSHCRSRSAPENAYDLESRDKISLSNFQHMQSLVQVLSQNDEDGRERRHSLHKRRAALEQNVEELQKQLQNQQAVRHALETAMGQSSEAISTVHQYLTPQAQEILYDISILEEEVGELEQQVLSVYRDIFTRCFSHSLANVGQKNRAQTELMIYDEAQHMQHQKPQLEHIKLQNVPGTNINEDSLVPIHPHLGDAISKSNEAMSFGNLPHSQNLVHYKTISKINTGGSLNEDGPRSLRDYLSATPNKLSEELIRCMVTIYCKLSDPAPTNLPAPDSPSSSTSSSTSLSSIHGILSDGWSPGHKAEHSYDELLINPFQVKGKSGVPRAYSSMVEVPWICVDKERLSHAARLLREFRSMVEQLEKVDPSKLKHDEKLAFWINVYNALLMHAYLAYGIPRNQLKRMTLLQRAAYRIGGRSINAYTIEHSILGCRSHRPTQWVQSLLLSGSKFKSGDERRSYAIKNPEPLVCFALCCGGWSDPAVRVYTSKNVNEELNAARSEYIQASIGFHNDKKVLLPKILEWYAREASISSSALLEWLSHHIDEKEKEILLKCIRSRPNKNASHCIEWQPYNFNFRYMFHPKAQRVAPCWLTI